jgi:hypothetical protein
MLDTQITEDVTRALTEDIGSGDLTAALLPADKMGQATIISREVRYRNDGASLRPGDRRNRNPDPGYPEDHSRTEACPKIRGPLRWRP